jgi:hypothetical protein
MKTFLLIAAILFGLLLGLPLFQMATGLPQDAILQGVETTATRPAFTAAAWWDGSLQSGFDTWINQRIGLRGAWCARRTRSTSPCSGNCRSAAARRC